MATSLFNLLNPEAIDGSIKPVEGVKTLSDTLGVPQAPITPVSTALVGANQDQAKMAGTPAQTTAALKMGQEFATAERTQQPQVIQTPEQQIKLDQAKKWTEELGSLGDRVVSAVAGLGQNIPVQTGAVLNEEWLKSSGLDVATQAKVQPALAAYNAAIQSGDEAAINKSIESLEAIVGKDKMGDLILSSNDPMAIGNWMAKQTPDAISVKMLRAANPDMFNSLFTGENSPYKSADEFAQALGLKDASELDNMKLSDLQAKTSALVTKGQDETTRLKAVLSDNGASATDRSAARNRLRELGVVGIEASEQELTELADSIQKAGVINVNGISVDINELLEDEHFSAAIDAYLDGDREAGQALPPGIKSMVDANVGLFDQIAKEAAQKEAGWQELKANVDSFNKSLTDAEGKGLSDEAQKALYEAAGIDTSIPNWKEIYTADKLNKVSSTGIASLFTSTTEPKDATKRAALVTNINGLVSSGVNLAELNALTPEELEVIGITGGDNWASSADFLIKRQAILNGTADPLSIAGLDGEDPRYAMQTDAANRAIAAAFGVSYSSPISVLDTNKDGNITPDEIKASITDISSVLTMSTPATDVSTLWDILGVWAPGVKQHAFDGKITGDDLFSMVATSPGAITADSILKLENTFPTYKNDIESAVKRVVAREIEATGAIDIAPPLRYTGSTSETDPFGMGKTTPTENPRYAEEVALAAKARDKVRDVMYKYSSVPGFPVEAVNTILNILNSYVTPSPSQSVTLTPDRTKTLGDILK